MAAAKLFFFFFSFFVPFASPREQICKFGLITFALSDSKHYNCETGEM